MTDSMRRVSFICGSFLIIAALTFAAASAWAESWNRESRPARTVAVIHCDYHPVSFRDKNSGVPSGFAVDIIDSVAVRAGLQVEYICKNTWPQMIAAIANGEADFGVLLRSVEREKKLQFTVPIDMTYLSFFARSQSHLEAGKVPQGYTVGVIRGSMSHEQLKKRETAGLRLYADYQEGIFGLLSGEADLFAGEESMVLKHARKTGLEDHIKKVGRPFVERERSLAVRKDNTRLLGLLNKGLEGFAGSPEYQRAYLKWYGRPTPYWTSKRILLASGLLLLVAVLGMATWRYKSIARINSDLRRSIDERRHAQDVMRESEAKYKSVVENIGIGISFISRDMQILALNRQMKEWFPAIDPSKAPVCYTAFNDPPREVPCSHCPTALTLKDGMIHEVVTETPHKGGIINYRIKSSPVKDEGGNVIAAVELVEDITERKQAEAELNARERQLAESQRIAHVGSWEHNLSTGRAAWSNELFRLLGLDPEKDRPDFQMFFDMIHPDDQPRLEQAIDETLRLHKPYSIDYRFILKDGATRVLHAQAELIDDDSANPVILRGTCQDITERKRAEEKMRQSEEFIRSILDTVDEGFIVVDRDYRIVTANKAYCSQVGCDDTIIGRHCFEISHKTGRPCYEEGEDCAVRHVLATGEPHSVLHRHKNATGDILYVETKGFPIRDGSGAVTSVIETINNITERYLLEAERSKIQKLEAVGTLAGGIAHDFNNLLQGIFGYISMIRMNLDQRGKALDMLGQAEKALHLSVNLTSQLLTFSKGGMPAKKKVALPPLIENSVKFALSGSRINYTLDYDKSLWRVEADDGQIGRVIQNIVLNAEQAMPMGGTIAVSAKNMPSSGKGLPLALPEGNYVEISVTDAGIGIPQEWLSRIFDPYFTTKDKGSGLGLAISYSIIKNHGGMIDVKSKPGEGTTFIVYLPALEANTEIAGTVSETVAVSRKGRILVMDDEAIIRDITGMMLTTLGHEVEFAENGEEALSKYREALQSCRRFDAVILDLTIRGGKGGEETIKELLALDPEVKAIVSSGYANSSAMSESSLLGFKTCLTKPYDVNDLNDALTGLFT